IAGRDESSLCQTLRQFCVLPLMKRHIYSFFCHIHNPLDLALSNNFSYPSLLTCISIKDSLSIFSILLILIYIKNELHEEAHFPSHCWKSFKKGYYSITKI
ncbi:hypothetical protein ACJX0J_028920, partial [Zea mays]